MSKSHDTFILVGEGVPEIFEADERHPPLELRTRRVGGSDYLYTVPMTGNTSGAGPMMGGNFVYSSDSRFRRLSPGPLPVHDRYERG
jgi:hypothetical protein